MSDSNSDPFVGDADRRQELDTYMPLIGELQLKYGRNIFYQYHKAFSSKAALYIMQYDSRLDWSVLDTELLVMVAFWNICPEASPVLITVPSCHTLMLS
ncbi:hypothetical protein VZT92_005540 [Zoarces viviparus]|uniref:Uncharacterized protein n=1 Tax=Zoarces viviparus TaxID=48416 RepID=A0AAW1FTX7_ZOAVI